MTIQHVILETPALAGDDFAWHRVGPNLVDDFGIINASFAVRA